MKRELCCAACAKRWLPLIGKFPGEHIELRVGSLRFTVLCDGCNRKLEGGTTAHAVSLYTDSRPYTAWEGEYLIPLPADD